VIDGYAHEPFDDPDRDFATGDDELAAVRPRGLSEPQKKAAQAAFLF
jgi:hypothetical protein